MVRRRRAERKSRLRPAVLVGVDALVAAAAVEVPGLARRRIRALDDRRDAIFPGDVPELTELDLQGPQVQIEGSTPSCMLPPGAGLKADFLPLV